jgi:hypothetical protein
VAVTQLLQQYEREEANFLDSTVTSDDMWLHYFTSESKTASKQWKHTHSSPSKKSENNFLAVMITATVFWDSKGVLNVDFSLVKNPSTLLNGKVKLAIQSKQRKRQDSVCFLQDKLVLTLPP